MGSTRIPCFRRDERGENLAPSLPRHAVEALAFMPLFYQDYGGRTAPIIFSGADPFLIAVHVVP